MRLYETVYLVNPHLETEQLSELKDKINSVVERYHGVVIKEEDWGKRQLAYKVMKFDTAYYVLLQFCGGPDIPQELNREMRLDDRVIKYLTVKLSDKADPEALKKEAASREDETKEDETKEVESAEQTTGDGEV